MKIADGVNRIAKEKRYLVIDIHEDLTKFVKEADIDKVKVEKYEKILKDIDENIITIKEVNSFMPEFKLK